MFAFERKSLNGDEDMTEANQVKATAPAAAAGEQVFRPCGRAFFVYYVALLLCFGGPRLNPDVGVPVWTGDILGLIVLAAVVYMKWGQWYRITDKGVVKMVRWPVRQEQLISWENLGEVDVRRGLTQSLLRVGNLFIDDSTGRPPQFWFGLSNPKAVKELIEQRRPS